MTLLAFFLLPAFFNGMTSLVPLISTLEHKALVTWFTQVLHDHVIFLYQLSVWQLWPSVMKLPRPRLSSRSHMQRSTSFEQFRIASEQNTLLTPLKRPMPGNYSWKTLLTHMMNCLIIVGWVTNFQTDMTCILLYIYIYKYFIVHIRLYCRLARTHLLHCGFHLTFTCLCSEHEAAPEGVNDCYAIFFIYVQSQTLQVFQVTCLVQHKLYESRHGK